MILYALGQAEIEVGSTFELAPGDQLYITFPFGARGWLKYGGEETFTVVSIDPATGEVQASDQAGEPLVLPGGTRAELERRLAEITSFGQIRIIRPSAAPAGPVDFARLLGLPDGYDESPASTWGELAPGDYVYLGLGVPRLLRVERVDADLVTARVVGHDDPAEVGNLVYNEPGGIFWETDAVFRRARAEGASWAWPAAAAAAGVALLVFS